MRAFERLLSNLASSLLLGLLASGCAAAMPSPRATAAPATKPAEAEATPAARLAKAVADLAASRYRSAETGLRALLDGPERVPARRALGDLLLLTGRYAEAGELAEQARNDGEEGLAFLELHARSLRAQGHLDEAIAVLTAEAANPEARRVRVLLGELLIERGDRRDAEAPLMSVLEDYNADRIRDDDGPGLVLVGRASHLLRSPRDANDAYNLAEQKLDHDVELLLYRAELFLEKYDSGHAEEVIQEILERAPSHPDALVAMAHIKLAQTYDFDAAEELARAALTTNPRHAEARFVLAGIALRDMELARADAELDQGLRAHPRDLRLLSLKAAVRFLADDSEGFAGAERVVLDLNPEYSSLYQIIGEYAEWEHRYDEIVALMRRAILIDARDAKARADLGINLLRAGEDVDGVRSLAAAFDQDPFNVRVLNTLNLYEKVISNQYESVASGPFRIRYHKDQRALLERYVPQLLEKAWGEMVERYGFAPRTPLPVELYPEREQFAVRTSGLPNIGIQGVCFGRSIAAMSPGKEQFNLGMTLWHELSHVFHIQRSKSHVPRWFTEGLAEWETLNQERGWRRELDPQLYDALRLGRLPELGDMNRAFTRAEDMDDMATAYYASTRIIVMLERKYGMKRLEHMLSLWGEGKRTPEVIEIALQTSPAALDAAFREFAGQDTARFRAQFVPIQRTGDPERARAEAEASPKDLQRQCRHALAAIRGGDQKTATEAMARARAIAPKDPDVLWLEAQFAFASDDFSGAERAIQALLAAGHDGYDIQLGLAAIHEHRRDLAGMKVAFERARTYDPLASEPLGALADLAREVKDRDGEIAALKALTIIEEHHAAAHQRLMRLLIDARRWDEAVRVGGAAVYVDMTGLNTHLLYAEALSGAERHRDAVFELESALLCPGRPPDYAAVHADLARAWLTLGDRSRARSAAVKGRELDPTNGRLKDLPL
ncbi:MAG: tetratricopeptide repeat protein [Polyangiaceae bacterium]|nr:tetratricopeptide repeat protein [Polyangiaceae bacterium]